MMMYEKDKYRSKKDRIKRNGRLKESPWRKTTGWGHERVKDKRRKQRGQTEKGREEGIKSPISLCMNFIRRFTTANRKRKGGGMTRGGERRRQTRGMTCLHKKGKEIRNLNYCGMRKALWHQFSWQPENSAACLPACAVRKRKQAADEGRGWRKRRRREWRRAEKIITVQQCSRKKNKHRRKKKIWRNEE